MVVPQSRRARMLRILLAGVVSAALAAGARPLYGAADEAREQPRIEAIHIGFGGAYKLGCWTSLTVEVHGTRDDFAGRVEVIATDPDGVPTTVTAPFRPAADARVETTVSVRICQETAPLTVRLVDDAGQERARRTFFPRRKNAQEADTATTLPHSLAATNRLVASFGSRTDLAAELARVERAPSPHLATRTVAVTSLADLPRTWHDFESADIIVLSTARAEQFSADATPERISALTRWVELGGRVVLFAGAAAPELLTASSPLAPLLPGRFDGEIVELPSTAPLEVFSGAVAEIGRRRRVSVPRLEDVLGSVLAEGPGGVPLVVRARRGLGEITFVAVDPEAPPIDVWNERTAFLRQVLQWPAPLAAGASDSHAASTAAADLTNQLRSALDQHFVGIQTAPFALVALLVIGYVALVGPGDYFFLRRVTRRMELTWLTFPLIVATCAAGAYALAHRMKGDELRVNQLEIVDVDLGAGSARGTVYTHLFIPQVERYTLSLAPHFAGQPTGGGLQSSASPPSATGPGAYGPPLVATLGVPGYGLGAMQGQGGQPSLFQRGYEFGADLDRLVGLPIEQWSTKSLMARWTAALPTSIEAELRPLGDDQLVGRIANRTAVRFEDCVLIRGAWAYKLAPLDPGAAVTISETRSPRPLKSTLTSVSAGDDANVRTGEDGSVPFDAMSTDVARIAKLMMFYEALGGASYAGTPHRYHSFLDMSRLLRGDQAILLARAPASAASRWLHSPVPSEPGRPRPQRPQASTDAPAPLASDHDRRWTYYRFVIPFAPGPAPTANEPEQPPTPEPAPLIGPLPQRPTPPTP